MAKKLGDFSGDLRKAMMEIKAEALISIQAELGDEAISPRDEGRFRSSWYASSGTASNAVAPEGADSPNTDATSVSVTLKQDAILTNNLPYAQSVAIAGEVTSQSRTWFHDFRNSRIPIIIEQAARSVKGQEGF